MSQIHVVPDRPGATHDQMRGQWAAAAAFVTDSATDAPGRPWAVVAREPRPGEHDYRWLVVEAIAHPRETGVAVWTQEGRAATSADAIMAAFAAAFPRVERLPCPARPWRRHARHGALATLALVMLLAALVLASPATTGPALALLGPLAAAAALATVLAERRARALAPGGER